MAISFIHTFVNAGETTRALVSFVARGLGRAPRPATPARRAARAGRENAGIEETLRCYPLNWSGCRTATQDLELGGQAVGKKDDYLMMAYASANRDEDVWEAPDEFDVAPVVRQGPPVVRLRGSTGAPTSVARPAPTRRSSSSGSWPGSRIGSWPALRVRWANPFLQGLSSVPMRFQS